MSLSEWESLEVLGRRAGAIHWHSADKYGTLQNRALCAWKQWLMNKQKAERILLINKMIPLGAERDRREGDKLRKACFMLSGRGRWQPLPQWTRWTGRKSFLNLANWGLMSLADLCTHVKEAIRVKGGATTWTLKLTSMMMTSIRPFLWFLPRSTPHASTPKWSNMLTRKKKYLPELHKEIQYISLQRDS